MSVDFNDPVFRALSDEMRRQIHESVKTYRAMLKKPERPLYRNLFHRFWNYVFLRRKKETA
jgi:hypothetical protein